MRACVLLLHLALAAALHYPSYLHDTDQCQEKAPENDEINTKERRRLLVTTSCSKINLSEHIKGSHGCYSITPGHPFGESGTERDCECEDFYRINQKHSDKSVQSKGGGAIICRKNIWKKSSCNTGSRIKRNKDTKCPDDTAGARDYARQIEQKAAVQKELQHLKAKSIDFGGKGPKCEKVGSDNRSLRQNIKDCEALECDFCMRKDPDWGKICPDKSYKMKELGQQCTSHAKDKQGSRWGEQYEAGGCRDPDVWDTTAVSEPNIKEEVDGYSRIQIIKGVQMTDANHLARTMLLEHMDKLNPMLYLDLMDQLYNSQTLQTLQTCFDQVVLKVKKVGAQEAGFAYAVGKYNVAFDPNLSVAQRAPILIFGDLKLEWPYNVGNNHDDLKKLLMWGSETFQDKLVQDALARKHKEDELEKDRKFDEEMELEHTELDALKKTQLKKIKKLQKKIKRDEEESYLKFLRTHENPDPQDPHGLYPENYILENPEHYKRMVDEKIDQFEKLTFFKQKEKIAHDDYIMKQREKELFAHFKEDQPLQTFFVQKEKKEEMNFREKFKGINFRSTPHTRRRR